MRAAVAYHGPERIAAIITEPVQGAGGVFPPPPGYLQGLRELCDESGALLMFDEVITGFGRLGSWFGSHHFGVTPDLMTFAKGITSGYLPLGGVVVGPAPAQLARSRRWLPSCARWDVHGSPQLLRRRDRQPRDHARRGPARAGRRRRAPPPRRPRRARGPRPGRREIRGEGLMQASHSAAADRGLAGRGAAGAGDHRPRAALRERGRLLAAADHQRRRDRRDCGRGAGGAGRRGGRRLTRAAITLPPRTYSPSANAGSSCSSTSASGIS